ncbi:hypothetical protein [Salegentibacter salinarum]|nr:hypothetical protein [Salegentibacter salinarum]
MGKWKRTKLSGYNPKKENNIQGKKKKSQWKKEAKDFLQEHNSRFF